MTVMFRQPADLVDALAAYDWLMAHATDWTSPDTHVFACVLAARLTGSADKLDDAVGLPVGALDRMLAKHFSRLPDAAVDPLTRYLRDRRGCGKARSLTEQVLAEEMDELRVLLLDHCTADIDEAHWLAAMVARACLFSDHLWQDLGLTSRRDLSGLLNRHFHALAARNIGDMKWKKFFYKQLCEREGLNMCKAPSCGVCTDYKVCFGPEE
jgi:nitrogen fixation protein NifQ